MKRKLLSILTVLLAITCAFTMFTACTPSVDNDDDGGKTPEVKELTYELNSDGESYMLTGFKAEGFSEVIIPDTYEGKPVTVIATDAFTIKTGSLKIKSIKVGKNVEIIKEKAFQRCDNLETFEFADGSKLTTIEKNAIGASILFKNIIIPESVVNIASGAFSPCQNLNIFLNIEEAAAGFEENWSIINFDTYGDPVLPAAVFYKGEWSVVNGLPVKNA